MGKEKETDVMDSVAILVGLMVGGIFSYFYLTTMGILASLNLWNLIVFLTIPTFSGFVSGLISRKNAMKNGLFVGLLNGTILLLITLFILIAERPETTLQGDQFILFYIMTIFLWMMLSATGALLGKEYYK